MFFFINLAKKRRALAEKRRALATTSASEVVLGSEPRKTGIFRRVFGFLVTTVVIGTMELALSWVAEKVRTFVWNKLEKKGETIVLGGGEATLAEAAG